MTDAIAHRGPDGHGLFYSGSSRVGLGHRRLAIIDLSDRGLQPMWDADKRVLVVFNGEIYNYRELRGELIAAGYRFLSECDTEVICNLYLHEGREFVRRLEGMFAFALWDAGKKELLVARDEGGIKPLYYTTTRKGFGFSSELKALLRLGDVPRDLDPVAIASYVSLLYCPTPRTPLIAVQKLNAGEMIVVREGKIANRIIFRQAPLYAPEVSNKRQAIADVVNGLRDAVRKQMVSDVPVGCFLSGGLDSSAIARFARDSAGPDGLKCFTICPAEGAMEREGFASDLPYARRVARHIGVDLVEVPIAAEMLSNVRRLVYLLDEPQADPASLNVLYISEAARAAGIKVLLSGAGGDDLFSGYRRHRAAMMEYGWTWIPMNVRLLMARAASGLGTGAPWRRRVGRVASVFADNPERRLAKYFTWLPEAELFGVFSSEFREQLVGTDTLAPYMASLVESRAGGSRLDAMLQLEQRFFLPDHNLNYTDKMSMAAGVEVRVPFLERELVQLSRRIPARWKQNGSEGKWILKKAMEPYLPRDVIYRPKTGFGAPLREWMRNGWPEEIAELLSEKAIVARGIFDYRAVQDLAQRDRAGRVDAAYSMYAIACIEMWCRLFADTPSLKQY